MISDRTKKKKETKKYTHKEKEGKTSKKNTNITNKQKRTYFCIINK